MDFTEVQKGKALILSEKFSSDFNKEDAFVLGFVVKQLSGEIEKYKKFKGEEI